MWHHDSKATCTVTGTSDKMGKYYAHALYYSVFVPARVSELGRLSWDMVQYQIEAVLPQLGDFLREANVPEAVIMGSTVSTDLSRQGKSALVDVLALLSFTPGGVNGFGYHFESHHADGPHSFAIGRNDVPTTL